MLSPLARRVARAIRDRGLWNASDRVAVALSGGADSVALLLLLAELAPRASWTLSGIIHVDHGLRPDDSEADAGFCRALASRLNLPMEIERVDVRARMVERGCSVEVAARELRYEAFGEAVGRLGATVVVTGHTCDDQAETVLLRLLRGATARGVSAVRPRRGIFARPLLDCRRAELRDYLASRSEPFREDSTNTDVSVPRNHLRQELLPVVESLWPKGIPALARFAEASADDELWLSRQASVEMSRLSRTSTNGVELNRELLTALPAALARRVVRDAIERVGGRADFRDIEAVRRLTRTDKEEGQLDLHRVHVRRVQGWIELGRSDGRDETPAGFARELRVPGEIRIDETRVTVRASFLSGTEPPRLTAGWDAMAALQRGPVTLPLLVRNRKPGDRFRPLGAPGERKLQDVLVDRKVPRGERDGVPVIVDGAGRIVWVAGVAMAHGCRVTAPEDGMVILEMQKGKQ